MNSPRLIGAKYDTGEEWRNNSRKNDKMESKQKQKTKKNQLWMWLVKELKSDAVKNDIA